MRIRKILEEFGRFFLQFILLSYLQSLCAATTVYYHDTSDIIVVFSRYVFAFVASLHSLDEE